MEQYEEISFDNYCVENVQCVCNACTKEFTELTPSNYELVCFEDEQAQKYFLPTYGEYGYLHLLKKLVPQWNPKKEITKEITDLFEAELNKITPFNVTLASIGKCPFCRSEDIMVLKRASVLNCPVNRLKIDKSFIDK